MFTYLLAVFTSYRSDVLRGVRSIIRIHETHTRAW